VAPPPPAAASAIHFGAGYYSYVNPSLTWAELADNLSDLVPRYDRDGRSVCTLAATAIARGASQADAIKAVLTPVLRRMQLFRPPYPNMKMGQISEDELKREADFLKLKISDFKPLYTNDLIDEIHKFDRQAVIDQAKAYKI